MKTYILVLSAILLPVIGMISKDKVTLLVCLSVLAIITILFSFKKVTNN